MKWISENWVPLVLAAIAGSCAVALALMARAHRSRSPVPVEVTPKSAAGVDDLVGDVEATKQTCAVDVSGLTWVEAECLRRNYLRLSEEDRYELDLTFASIVDPGGVPE